MSTRSSEILLEQFLIGQRWISNTEPELGLGIVSSTDHRYVTISFPAADEQRVYAKNNAPLTRVQYRVGDTVHNNDNQTLIIEEVLETEGYITYQGRTPLDEQQKWGEVELDCFVQFSKPQDRLFAGQIDRLREYKLRHQTLQHQQQLAKLSTTGLQGPRVQLLQHQLYIANEVGHRFAPRVLLADEVGLGKTIEAGLIIHQQLVKGLSERVLICVPETLAHQWLVEMLRRFNLQFTLLDEERVMGMQESEIDNPFEDAQLILCSLSFLTENEERLEQAMLCDWDLLVVDEAHHLEWQPEEQSVAYRSIELLARISRGLLLLTATPEQVGLDSHFARLRLLDPDRYYDLESFKQEQSHFQTINKLVQKLLDHSSENLSEDKIIINQLTELLGAQAKQLLSENSLTSRQHLVNQLLDRHGTGRVLFRNTRAAVKGFPGRQLNTYPLQASDEPSLGFSDAERVQWLIQWLKQHKQEKVLIICHDPDTALDLETHLNLRSGVRSAVFYEGLSLIERDRAAAYFADLEDGAQVLVCSEIGSEGRNFQFSHHLIMFDLPLNPDLIEQRIGRLDRIGQTETVQIHIPYLLESEEEQLLHWYHRGINCFERVCPIGHAIYEEFQQQLSDCLAGKSDLEKLIEATSLRTTALLDELSKGRDQLLELNSCKPELAEKLVAELENLDEDNSLIDFMNAAFEVYGVDYERHSEKAFVAHPSDHMQCDHFPGLPDEGITATYCRQQALSREDMHYLTWEHPMVTGVMDMISSSERGNTAICTIKLPPLQPGSLLVEALFQFSCPAPKNLQMQRFVESGCVRLLCDNNFKALEGIITPDHLNTLGQSVKLATAKQLVQHARKSIDQIISHMEEKALDLQRQMAIEATEKLESSFDEELERLIALADVNPNIRREEIEHLRTAKDQGKHYLSSSSLRLDSIRVAVVV